jgi:hypothetical protein
MPKADEYKNQHLIPRSYLAAWCDPNPPEGYDPYVWRIRLADQSKFRRSPEKTFTQNNRYTIVLSDGKRDLAMEKTLGQTEGDFVTVRECIVREDQLDLADKAALCIFAGAMATRSERQGEHWRGQMQNFLEQMLRFEKKFNLDPNRVPDRSRLAPNQFSVTSKELEQKVEEAHIDIIKHGLPVIAGFMYSMMHIKILVSNDPLGFITSDSPFVMFNPELRKMPPGIGRNPGLMQAGTEITLPLTPKHALLATRKALPTPEISPVIYQRVSQLVVDELNRTTRAHSLNEIISWTGETRAYWFEDGDIADDAWENTDEGKAFRIKKDESS